MIIGLTGVARSGKDSTCTILKQLFLPRNLVRVALADCLKEDCYDFLMDRLQINVFDCSDEDKANIRPFLVWYGKMMRKATNGRYWIEKANIKVKKIIKEGGIPCITDIRYANDYPCDELCWIKQELNGKLIHISRMINGKILQAPNEDEAYNDPILKQQSDFQICNEDGDFDGMKRNLEKVLKSL
jgi:hypothetical protein